MKTAIHAFGRYVPNNRIKAAVIAAHWKRGTEQADGLGIVEKAVAARDEDAFTIAWEAAKQALETGAIDPKSIGAIFVGSESHPYAVKPTSGMLVSALKLNPLCHCADLEFACKAGTAALQIVSAMVASKQIQYGIAIGTDTAQSKPGDALEYSAAAGAAAFVVGASTTKRPGLCSNMPMRNKRRFWWPSPMRTCWRWSSRMTAAALFPWPPISREPHPGASACSALPNAWPQWVESCSSSRCRGKEPAPH
jgi:3-hydroxy-3-methylglutaryl CoA synthase